MLNQLRPAVAASSLTRAPCAAPRDGSTSGADATAPAVASRCVDPFSSAERAVAWRTLADEAEEDAAAPAPPAAAGSVPAPPA